MPYLLDTNIFIEAKNRYYGLDFCPAFWDWLVECNDGGIVFSVEKVGEELIAGADDLALWASQRGSAFFLEPPDPGIVAALSTVSQWVMGRGYDPSACATFLSAADYYLVGHALAEQCVLVTHERGAAESRKRVKIPDVCGAVGVEVITPFDMLRREGARFQLGAPSRLGHSGLSVSSPA